MVQPKFINSTNFVIVDHNIAVSNDIFQVFKAAALSNLMVIQSFLKMVK